MIRKNPTIEELRAAIAKYADGKAEMALPYEFVARLLDAADLGLHLQERLAAVLPAALAETDDAGSEVADWTGSEYVDRLAASLASRLREEGVK